MTGTYIQGEEHGTPVYAVLLRGSVTMHVSFPVIHEHLNTALEEYFLLEIELVMETREEKWTRQHIHLFFFPPPPINLYA